MKVFLGTAACKGIAIGKAAIYHEKKILIPSEPIQDTVKERQRFDAAREEAERRLAKLYEKALESMGEEEAEIFDMHRMMLADEDLLEAILHRIEAEQKNALQAVSEAGAEFAAVFEAMDDAYMQARAADVRDISALLLRILAGVTDEAFLQEPSIVVAEDLTPSETINMDKRHILAFVTRKGSTNSHTAILARTMGIPSLVQADIPLDDRFSGQAMAVDGYEGACYVLPDEKTLGLLTEKKLREEAFRKECEKMKCLPSITKGGKKIQVFANIGSNEDIAAVLENDGEGVGLFRSEFLFLGRKAAPSEEAQLAAYQNVAEKMAGKKVIIRTLDIGADKQADYLNLPAEENPALGYRAIRICLDRKDLFQAQLRAILRAAAHGRVGVMFPMINDIWEVQACKAALQDARESLEKDGIAYGELEVGIMIETPAAALLSDELAAEVDFFSVGTNDLTQYTLAADRQNALVARFANPHHSAVLKLLQRVADSAKARGIWAGICGELAGDTSLTDTFIQMGYAELSVAPPQILPLRKTIRESEA